MFLDDQKKLLANSFGEALRSYPSLERSLAVGFKYTAEFGVVTATIWLEKTDKEATNAPAPDSDHQLVIEVTPEDLPQTQTLFFALQGWAESVQLPKRDAFFERYGGWLALPALIALANLSPSTSSPAYYKEQARALLASDGASFDQSKAIRLLLSIAAEAPVPKNLPARVRADPEYYGWLVIAVICSLATLYVVRSPVTLLGLGRGEARIALWERTRRFFIYSVPTAAVTWYVLPSLMKRLGLG